MRVQPSDSKLTGLFLDMLAAEQGAGPNTLDAYRRDLTDFSEFLGRVGHSFADAETQILRDYLADLDSRGFKSTSVARRLSAMRHLYRFLLNERIRTEDPAAILSGPKRGRGSEENGQRGDANQQSPGRTPLVARQHAGDRKGVGAWSFRRVRGYAYDSIWWLDGRPIGLRCFGGRWIRILIEVVNRADQTVAGDKLIGLIIPEAAKAWRWSGLSGSL